MVSELVKEKLINYKSDVVDILSDKTLNLQNFEKETLSNLYELIGKVLLGMLVPKRHKVEDVLKARLLESGIILSATKEEKVMKLAEKLGGGKC